MQQIPGSPVPLLFPILIVPGFPFLLFVPTLPESQKTKTATKVTVEYPHRNGLTDIIVA
jgi:hypothetical protein